MYFEFISQVEKQQIDIKNLININKNNLLFGYKNKIVNILKFCPLIRPYSNITFSSKLLDENELKNNDLIGFDDNQEFTIKSKTFEESIEDYNINMRTLRVSNVTEILPYEQILFNMTSSTEIYNQNFDILDNTYKINLNSISFKFKNNYSLEQEENNILINHYTNQNIDTERLEDNNMKSKQTQTKNISSPSSSFVLLHY